MKVLIVASELMPYISSGILGKSVQNMVISPHEDVEVEAVLPFYSFIDEKLYDIKKTDTGFSVPVGEKTENAEIWKGRHPVSGSTVWFVSNKYFERDGLYGNITGDYPDNAERFVFFARAVLELALTIIKPTIVHCNDWQASLIPVYLKEVYEKEKISRGIKTLLSIHDIRYQGRFWLYDLCILNLGWDIFSPEKLEYYNDLNFLKGGIVYSDAILTVNEDYFNDISTAEYGCGLEGVVSQFKNKVFPVCQNGQNLYLEDPVTSSLGKNLSAIYKKIMHGYSPCSTADSANTKNVRDVV